jgi:hypothetical protein
MRGQKKRETVINKQQHPSSRSLGPGSMGNHQKDQNINDYQKTRAGTSVFLTRPLVASNYPASSMSLTIKSMIGGYKPC